MTARVIPRVPLHVRMCTLLFHNSEPAGPIGLKFGRGHKWHKQHDSKGYTKGAAARAHVYTPIL